MAKKKGFLSKRMLIDNANSTVVIVTGIAAFIFIFSLVASKTLVSQATYQNRVIGAKKTALHQLKSDITAANQLKTSYAAFVDTTQNVIGGNPNGSGAQDGNNAQIVLDALPSSYDFPALATTLEKLLTSQGITITSIGGTDDELAQGSHQTSTSPEPVPMPFNVAFTGNYAAIQSLIGEFGTSIRPFQIQTMDITGNQDELTVNITAQTFYQPAKSLNISTKVVK